LTIVQKTIDLIDVGRSDTILSIPTQIAKVDQYIYGTRQGCYYLYGAESGVGKTTYVREKHIHIPYETYKRINDPSKLDIEIVDFSLEISSEINLGAAITRKIFHDYDKVLSVDKIFGWNPLAGKLTEEEYRLVRSYDSYFEDFEKKLTVIDEETTPTKFHDTLMQVAKKHGKFTKEGRWISECGAYAPNNPRLYIIVVVDTINLSDMDSGHESIKSSIDRISRIAVWFRNKCGFTPIIIQQFNAEISAVDRSRYGITTPLLRDFEDSKRTTKDANVVFGLYDPQRHVKEDNPIFKGYDISILKSWFRSIHLLKNRNSEPNKVIPLKFDGAVGTFTQLPEAKDMTPEEYVKATKH
jgi:replicative DNA helicase